jgi:hypothetical protein
VPHGGAGSGGHHLGAAPSAGTKYTCMRGCSVAISTSPESSYTHTCVCARRGGSASGNVTPPLPY